MRRFFLGLVVGAGVPIALIAMAWSAVFLYWHVKLGKAVWTVEEYWSGGVDESTSYFEALQILRSGGCRSLPHLLGAVHLSQSKEFVDNAVILAFPLMWQDEEAVAVLHYNMPLPPEPEHHTARCAVIRAWWAQSSSRHHQWWRVWSSSCPVDRLSE